MREFRNLWIALLALALLAPAGYYLPRIVKAGAAWGEWGREEIMKMIGYVPAGMEREAGRWKAPLPDYALPGRESALPARGGVSYAISAVIGIGACGGGGYLLARWIARRKR